VYEGTARLVNGKPTFTGRVNVATRVLDAPMRWERPRRIFVNSMSDLFHESVSDGTILGLFAVMAAAPQHQFQILTKRPGRALEWFTRIDAMAHGDHGTILHEAAKGLFGYTDRRRPVIQADSVRWPLPNVWLGVSVEDQAAADERIPLLLRTPAAIRFLSCEPLLGAVDVRRYLGLRCEGCGVMGYDVEPRDWPRLGHGYDAGHVTGCDGDEVCGPLSRDGSPGIDWVIAGGESGPRARPMQPDWARSLRDQCVAAGVPFFFKQWGEYSPETYGECVFVDGVPMKRVGKKAAGHLLDAVEHHEFPRIEA
jgi:protein gp37